MTKQLEAMKMALEVLETCDAAHPLDGGYQWYDDKAVDKAITALRAAIETAEQKTVCGLVFDAVMPPEVVSWISKHPPKGVVKPVVPEGYVLVPVEPTEEMLNALGNSWTGVNIATWQRLIAAAQKGGA